jgi:hypothetical protein
MKLESLIDTYGYLAILVGTFFEGETVLVLGGLAAYREYLRLPWVILAAFVGTLCGDQLFFYLGRVHSQAILAKRPSWKARVEKAQKLVERFRNPLILVFRFLYGLRTVTPFVIGMSTVPTGQVAGPIKLLLMNLHKSQNRGISHSVTMAIWVFSDGSDVNASDRHLCHQRLPSTTGLGLWVTE